MSSPPSSKSEEPLTFHPDFTEPATAQIFQAADGTAFRFPFETLIVFSSFFSDLKSLPHTDGSQDVIPLLSATSQGLAYSFAAILSVVRGTRSPPLPTPDEDAKAYDDVIDVADAYDLPVVLRALFRTAKASKPPPSAHTLYTLAVLSKSSDEVADLSLDLLAIPILDMDEWNKTTLRARYPLALVDLYNFHASFQCALNRLLQLKPSFEFAYSCKNNSPTCKLWAMWCYIPAAFALTHLVAARDAISKTPKLLLARDIYTPSTGCATCDKQIITVIKTAQQEHILPADYTFVV